MPGIHGSGRASTVGVMSASHVGQAAQSSSKASSATARMRSRSEDGARRGPRSRGPTAPAPARRPRAPRRLVEQRLVAVGQHGERRGAVDVGRGHGAQAATALAFAAVGTRTATGWHGTPGRVARLHADVGLRRQRADRRRPRRGARARRRRGSPLPRRHLLAVGHHARAPRAGARRRPPRPDRPGRPLHDARARQHRDDRAGRGAGGPGARRPRPTPCSPATAPRRSSRR